MSKRTLIAFSALGLWLAASAYGQQPAATVTFKLDFPGANPSRYEIAIRNDGTASYASNGKISDESDPSEAAPVAFTVSGKLRAQIFDLAKRARYFTANVDSGRKNIANTGAKTLAYKDPSHSSEATYNYSELVPVAQLTSIFQNLSTTLECGRRLSYFHKYEKLALEGELKRMEELQKENSLGDVQSIAPILKEIAGDSSVMNVSRARALRLVAAGK
ncbi:MAG: hypothetical protein J2P13_06890 [Acidobacteria bacterium]|nr:hypothetical protein [Acidobacteriota bacterium]